MTTLDRLKQILLAQYPLQAEAITPDASLEGLDIDSLGVMELFFAVEDEFGISVPNDKRDIKTVGDLVDYIDQLASQQNMAAMPAQRAEAHDTGTQRTVP